ncbi:MAG: RNA 3'-phosphate cyclase [Candidatus Lokiarchaeota archaeon]|nr:RNA 3'-phosphate cyclase [Candidatus Lokiarchaeota archaeon]
MNENKSLNIDGSFGEGGGAILRLSAGYSVLYQRPISIKNIRANRPKPGMRLQHLLGLKTLANLTGSTLSECSVGSVEVSFDPNDTFLDKVWIKVNTAASLGLLLQPVQIASLGLKNKKFEINLDGGGTFGKWAPSLNYLERIVYPRFEAAGLKIRLQIDEHGWYPKGGARVRCLVEASSEPMKPINLTHLGGLDLIQGEITITKSLDRNKSNVAERVKKSAVRTLKNKLNLPIEIEINPVDSLSPGVAIFLWARSNTGALISSGTILGEKSITSERLGEHAAIELFKYIEKGVPVDNYLSDQLIPLMGFAKGTSSIKVMEITSHARTNLELTKLFTNREYQLIKQENGTFEILFE